MLYEDRLDGRIDTGTYDKKATEIREQQDRLLQKVRAAEEAVLTPISEAVDLVTLTSRAVELFLDQPGAEQRKVLRLVLEHASWKAGELRMSFQEPFESLRLSNRPNTKDFNGFNGDKPNFDNWR